MLWGIFLLCIDVMTSGTRQVLLCSNWKWTAKWQKQPTCKEPPNSSKPLPFFYKVSLRFFRPCPDIYRKNLCGEAEGEIPQTDPGLQHLWVSVGPT